MTIQVRRRLRNADRWIFAPVDQRQIAGLRIGLSVLLLWRLTRHDFVALASQPENLYQPLSYMQLLEAMPSAGIVRTLLGVAMVAAAASVFGLWSRLALPVATLCSLVLFGMTTASGKVAHNDVLLMLCLIPLACGTTDRVWSLRSWWVRRASSDNASRDGTQSGWPWRVAILLVCGAYFFSGLAKLTHAGPGWVLSDNMRWILYANSDGRPVANDLSVFIADHPWLSRLSGLGIFVVELGFPLVLLRWRSRFVFVVAVLMLHLLTWFTLRLDYSAMAATVVVVMVWWPGVRSVVATLKARLVRKASGSVPSSYGPKTE